MSLGLHDILTIDDWSQDRMDEVRLALRDEKLAGAVRRWVMLSSRIGDDLRADLPDSEALVLYALSRRHPLESKDAERLTAAGAQIETALRNHESVSHILDRISEDADAFDEIWAEHASRDGQRSELRVVDRNTARRLDRRASRRVGTRSMSPWHGIAAVVVLFATVLALNTFVFDSSSVRITAEAGSTRTVMLEDGSSVRLVGPASVSFDESFDRQVTLTGSAFFDVTSASDPFSVRTDDALVTVLGTTFGVRDLTAGTEVALVSGEVTLFGRSASVRLAPGELSRIGSDGEPEHPVRADLTTSLAWTGLFVFRDTPLDEVVKTLGSEFDVDIKVHDDLRKETLTGTFDSDQGAEEILRVIAAALGARLHISDASSQFELRL